MTEEEKRQQRGNTVMGVVFIIIIAIGIIVNFLMSK